MPLQIIRQDITKVACDAIVNSTNPSMIGAGGADAAIHEAAGPKLDAACKKIGTCPVGEARITKGYQLPCRYVIHTVGPIWQDGEHGEPDILAACYRNSLLLAKKHRAKSVAVPLIGVNVLGVPRKDAIRIAVNEIGSFLMEQDLLVYLVIFGKEEFGISSRLFPDIKSYIDDNYADLHRDSDETRTMRIQSHRFMEAAAAAPAQDVPDYAPTASYSMSRDDTLSFIMEQIDESFSQMVLRKIDEKGMTDTECYKKANLDRKLFSKLRSNKEYGCRYW